MTKLVYVEGPDYGIEEMFREEGWEVVLDLDEGADLICLEGGADVSPSLYNEDNVSSWGVNLNQDLKSMGLIATARRLNIPVTGICRGAQLLNIYFKGSLLQHILGHAGPDSFVPYGDEIINCSSAHHQQMVVNEEEVDYVFHSEDGVPEIVRWKAGPIGVQYHPEYRYAGDRCRELFFELIQDCSWET